MKLIEILNEYDLRFKLEYDGVQKKWVATLRNDERSGCLMVIIKLGEGDHWPAKSTSTDVSPVTLLHEFCAFLQGKTIRDMRGKEILLPDEIEVE